MICEMHFPKFQSENCFKSYTNVFSFSVEQINLKPGRMSLPQQHLALHSDGADSRALTTQTRKEDQTFTSQDILRLHAHPPIRRPLQRRRTEHVGPCCQKQDTHSPHGWEAAANRETRVGEGRMTEEDHETYNGTAEGSGMLWTQNPKLCQ